MSNQKKYFFLLSIVLVFLSSCAKKDGLRAEEAQKEPTEMSMTNLADENYSSKRDELLELIAEEAQKEPTGMSMTNLADENYLSKRDELLELVKEVPYPDQPEQWVHWYLKQRGSFLVLEEHSDELLDYALDFFQDETLKYNEKKVVAYVLIGVDFEKYKYFLRDLVLCLSNGGNVDSILVGFCVYPGNPDLGIRRNFEDPVIKEAVEAYEQYRLENPIPKIIPPRR